MGDRKYNFYTLFNNSELNKALFPNEYTAIENPNGSLLFHFSSQNIENKKKIQTFLIILLISNKVAFLNNNHRKKY